MSFKKNHLCLKGVVLVTAVGVAASGCYRTDSGDSDSSDGGGHGETPSQPADFEESVPVEVTWVPTRGEIKYNCGYNDFTPSAHATVIDGEIRMLFTGCFVCESLERSASVVRESGGYRVLFTSESFSGACGTYVLDLRLYLGPGEVGDKVAVYMPSMEGGGVSLVTETVAEAAPMDCHNLPPCTPETSCVWEGEDEEIDLVCSHVPTCSGSYCVFEKEVCMMECATEACALGESYPLTPSCVSR